MTEYEALEVAHDSLMDRIAHLQAVYANNPNSVSYELAQAKGAARLIVGMLNKMRLRGEQG